MRQLRWISAALVVFGVTVWALSGLSNRPSIAGDGPKTLVDIKGGAAKANAAAGGENAGPPTVPPGPNDPAPENPGPPNKDLKKVYAIHDKYNLKLIQTKGIIGFGIMKDPANADAYAFRVYTTGNPKPTVDKDLDGVAVYEQFLPQGIKAFQLPVLPPNPRVRDKRPVSIGISVSNQNTPLCYSGTLGCRLRGPSNALYALSNNHVFALENGATIGDAIQQPSSGDNLCLITDTDIIGNLHKFVPIDFVNPTNRQDSAVMSTKSTQMGVSTLSDGYGTPRSLPVDPILGVVVQKYGRTSGFTKNATVNVIKLSVIVNYTAGPAAFINQFQVQATPSNPNPIFGIPGDSGSLVVDANRAPIGLLFAGAAPIVICNPIKVVLSTYDMVVDDGNFAPPTTPPDGKTGKFKRRLPVVPGP